MSLNLGIIASSRSSAPSASLLLDTYPGAAAAYSLRKLRTAYTGAAIRVRRSSDNTETDIGFNGGGGLDTTALTTFVGTGNGFVRTWYDQSGNARNIQSTNLDAAATQPRIIVSGVLQTINTKPSILANGTTDMLFNSIYTIPVSYTMFAVAYKGIQSSNTSTTPRPFFAGTDGGSNGMPYLGTAFSGNANQNKYYVGIIGGGTIVNSVDWNNDVTILAYNKMNGGSGAVVGLNGNSTTGTLANATNSVNYIAIFGNYNVTARRFAGKIPELILYASDQSANRTGIESNINSFYTIF